MSTSLSKLVDNLSEGLHNNKCLNCKSCLDYIKIKNEKLILKCFNCKNYYEKDFNKELIKRFASTYEFCNKNLNKFILLLRKGVYPYEYMDNWERFNETSLPNKESFYSNLNMENIDDIDYRHDNNVTATGFDMTSDMAPASSMELLAIQATVECGFTLKLVRDMIKTYNQMVIMCLKDLN